MTKRARWIIFYLAVLVFFSASYLTIVFSLGYRFDFAEWSFVSTGSFRVIANTTADVYVNEKRSGKTSFLEDSFSKGRLLPRVYSVRLQKEGYHVWAKNVSVVAGMFSDFPKIVVLPVALEKEIVATTSFSFPVDDSRVRGTKGKILDFDDHEIAVTWLNDTDYQPFKKEGDHEVIMRIPSVIDDVQWYKDHDHILLSSAGILYFSEIDKRGGLNTYELTSVKGPFFYDSDENAVFLMENGEIVKLKLS